MMLYPKSKIKEHLNNLGIEKNDTVFIHGNAGVVSQYVYDVGEDVFKTFFKELKDYLFDGTIIVPTFTYSATKGEVFNSDSTISEVGLFSEKFRLIDGVKRSQHPIFSVSAIGNQANYFIETRINDCFGEETFFDKMYLNNVKILTLGCQLERATFTHYVEQKLMVSYRYFKNFTASLINKGAVKSVDVSYFVRDLKLNTKLNLKRLEDEAFIQKKIRIGPFGRFKARSILSQDFYDIASKLIKSDKHALIGEQ